MTALHIAKVYGEPTPPLAFVWSEKDWLTAPVCVQPPVQVTTIGGPVFRLTVRLKLVVDVAPAASVSFAVNVQGVQDAVGVPVIAPVEALRLRPAGRAPALIDQAYGVVPAVPARVCE